MSDTPKSNSSLHPVFWIAGIAVTLFSLVGIASLTGLLPSRSATPTEPQAAVSPAPASAPVTAAPAPLAATPAPVAKEDAPKPVERHKTTAKQHKEKVAALPPPQGAGVPPDYAPPAAPVCADCGTIAGVRQIKHEGEGTGLGAVGGGVVGGLIGNNVGNGNGRTLATIAGMVGGGLLGNKIEKSQRETVSYQVSVKMEDGTGRVVNYDTAPPWRIGDPVKVVNGTLVAR
jgi:outer membrane lipoprotein SlyB